jgi:hypothetical protein
MRASPDETAHPNPSPSTKRTMPSLAPELASRFASIALGNVVREYPGKLDHVLHSEADALPPRALHPAFYGSYDWHSCVHMHWLLVHVRRLHPDLPQRAEIDALLARHLSRANIAAECAYLARPGAQSFERPYGWTWLMKLAHELALSRDAGARTLGANLAPLTAAFEQRYLAFLPKVRYPVRHGVHSNTAFGVMFALDFARHAQRVDLEALCVAKVREWYGGDRDAPVAHEPSGADFLSPSLVEADLMRRVLPQAEFAEWLSGWLPEQAPGRPSNLFSPVAVSDRGDPQIVHLDGLNLSRAWSLTSIAAGLPADDRRCPVLRAAAAAHFAAGMAGLASDDYLGAHWLASFAALALSA